MKTFIKYYYSIIILIKIICFSLQFIRYTGINGIIKTYNCKKMAI